MNHHKHSTKASKTPVHEPQEEGQRDKGVKSVGLLPSQNTPFHSSNTVLAVSSLTHNHPSPSFSGWKSQHKCDEWCCFGKHLMMDVWMVLMSHNESHHNHNTHHVCLPAFHSLCFPFTSTYTITTDAVVGNKWM